MAITFKFHAILKRMKRCSADSKRVKLCIGAASFHALALQTFVATGCPPNFDAFSRTIFYSVVL